MGIIQNPVIAVVLGVLTVVGNIAGLYDSNVMFTILGVVGFGSIAQLRAAIDSTGLKTYITVGAGGLSMVLYGLNIISVEQMQLALSVLLPVAAATLGHGVQKSGGGKKKL
jgi:hypothetical protein